MKPELKHAYPALQRDWLLHGSVLRRTGARGTPDFILSIRNQPGVAVFAEVKAIRSINEALGLEVMQAIELDELAKAGFISRVLAYRMDTEYWSIYYGPFVGRRLYGDTADYYIEHLNPRAVLGAPLDRRNNGRGV
jgi:hypothetical protein